jgi:hypothetical protein
MRIGMLHQETKLITNNNIIEYERERRGDTLSTGIIIKLSKK